MSETAVWPQSSSDPMANNQNVDSLNSTNRRGVLSSAFTRRRGNLKRTPLIILDDLDRKANAAWARAVNRLKMRLRYSRRRVRDKRCYSDERWFDLWRRGADYCQGLGPCPVIRSHHPAVVEALERAEWSQERAKWNLR
jgi:hypothetical protein